MRCPLCTDQTLEPHHRMGIEIDICPRCRGIWLDRGELDRLVAVEAPGAAAPAPAPIGSDTGSRPAPAPADRAMTRDDDRSDRSDRTESSKGQKPKKGKKKKSRSRRLADALEDLFDEIID